MNRIDDLLAKTSRTFALSIPLLPEPTRNELAIAYLLFRIADTLEDASDWPRQRQIEALERYVDLLDRPPGEDAAARAAELGRRWERERPIAHEGYLELLAETGTVWRELAGLSPAASEIVRRHTRRTTRGMAHYVARKQSGELRLDDLADLREYCYVVAGIVGELSTELFLLDRPELAASAGFLRQRAREFGEALQLVNILKDSRFDAGEGRRYLPLGVEPGEVFSLARHDLEIAAGYTNRIQAADGPRGIVAFCALPVRLAWATLDVVESRGPGAKISRRKVFSISRALDADLDAGRPAVPARQPAAVSG